MKKKILYIIFLVIFLMNFTYPLEIKADEIKKEDEIIGRDEKLQEEFSNINAPNILVGETNNESILYGKNVNEIVYPASLTKLMTAILVVENCELDEIATVSENAVISVPSGYVNANLQVGEELTIEDLLYVMLIPSANDAANVLAEYVGRKYRKFCNNDEY